MLTRTMPNIRKAVQAELDRRDWSAYRLIQELRGKRKGKKDVPPVTIYEYLRGETEINSGDLGLILDVLDLDIKRK